MKQLISLAWKEWSEAWPYLLIGLGVFLGLPLIGALEGTIFSHHRFEIETTPWIIALGGVLAVFVAVGITCRDLSNRIEDFWRSRPVSVSKWTLTKFVIGLAVVAACCTIPVLVEDALNRRRNDFDITYFLLNWIGVYSIAFAAGCLIRRTAHAAMFALAAMLLLLFLPMILPPLSWLNVTDYENVPVTHFWQSALFRFLLVTLGIMVAGAFFAVVAVRRGWHVESGKKMVYGSIGGALLILVASASYQIGSNLPILQEISFPVQQHVASVQVRGNQVVAETVDYVVTRLPPFPKYQWHYTNHRYTLGDAGLKPHGNESFSTTQPTFGYDRYAWHRRRELALPDGSRVLYGVQTLDQKPGPLQLWVTPISAGGVYQDARLIPITLWDENRDPARQERAVEYVFDHRLYVIGTHAGESLPSSNSLYANTFGARTAYRLAIIGLADPLNPKPLSINPMNYRFSAMGDLMQAIVTNQAGASFLMRLPDIPGLSPRQRLDVALFRIESSDAIEGDTICFDDLGYIAGFKVSGLTDRTASLTCLGVYKPGLLDFVFAGSRYMQDAQLKNGLLYISEDSPFNGSANGGHETLRPSISVIDTRGPHPMRMVGHFAAPGLRSMISLDDGRALVWGSKLWLIGPPPSRQ